MSSSSSPGPSFSLLVKQKLTLKDMYMMHYHNRITFCIKIISKEKCYQRLDLINMEKQFNQVWIVKPIAMNSFHTRAVSVRTRKLCKRKTTLKQYLSVFDDITQIIVSPILILSKMGLFMLISCSLDYLKSYFESKSRLPIPQLFGSHCTSPYSINLTFLYFVKVTHSCPVCGTHLGINSNNAALQT